MPRYRVHRIKEAPKENFRWAAHTGGLAIVKAKDYELGGEIQANSTYAAWQDLQMEGTPLAPGDILETVSENDQPGELQIAKYIGFEPAKWFVPEPKIEATQNPVEAVQLTGESPSA
jgi:hypothetical protein